MKTRSSPRLRLSNVGTTPGRKLTGIIAVAFHYSRPVTLSCVVAVTGKV